MALSGGAALALAAAGCGTQTPPGPTSATTTTTTTTTATSEPAPVGQGRPSGVTTAPVGPTTPSSTVSGTSVTTTGQPSVATPTTGTGTGTPGGSSAPGGTSGATGPTSPRTPAGPPASTDRPSGPSASSTTDAGAPPVSEFLAPDAVSRREASGRAQLVVSDVRVGAQPTFDRVVFDLTGSGSVGWTVSYVDDPLTDGSGAPVDLAGDSVLVVQLVGMALPGEGSTDYDPGMLLVPGTGLAAVTEVLRAAPFEGAVTAYIGTRGAHRFSVDRLGDPARLVVDVAHD